MGNLLCEQNFRDVWRRNKSVRAEIGQILHTHTRTHARTHTRAAKLVVRMPDHELSQHLSTSSLDGPLNDQCVLIALTNGQCDCLSWIGKVL